MSKKETKIVIDNCADCPHSRHHRTSGLTYTGFSSYYKCTKPDYYEDYFRIKNVDVIPDKCPLEEE